MGNPVQKASAARRRFHEAEPGPWVTYNISRMAGMIRPGLARKTKILPRNLGKSFSMVSWRTSYILFFPLERGDDTLWHLPRSCGTHSHVRDPTAPKLPLTAFLREPELCSKRTKKEDRTRSCRSAQDRQLGLAV